MKIFFNISLFLSLGLFIASCDDKLSLDEFPVNNNGGTGTVSETTYVQQSPVWTQFNEPEDVFVGNEPLIYVADTKNNRVVQLDLSGGEIGSLEFLNPTAISQDGNFDLLVVADSVTTLGDTLSAVYRVNLFEAGGIISSAAKYVVIAADYPTPLSSRRRKFKGVSVFPDNSFLVARSGPDNLNSLDPDNAILKVRGESSVQELTVLGGFQSTGNGVYSIENMSSINAEPGSSTNFIISRSTEDFGFKVTWFVYDNLKGTYDPKFLPGTSIDFVNMQLGSPEDVTFDNNRNIYIADALNDSLVKFYNTGKYAIETFGGLGSGENQLNNPMGTAHFNQVLYIADTGNNRIVRYKLSTDLN